MGFIKRNYRNARREMENEDETNLQKGNKRKVFIFQSPDVKVCPETSFKY
jgi:hypothetical protein